MQTLLPHPDFVVWCAAGKADTCAVTLVADLAQTIGMTTPGSQEQLAAAHELPPWLGDEALHRSHQSALSRKDPAHYGPLFPGVPDDLPYVWPAADRDRRVPLS
ncbi:hypothetical protein MycrhN_5548 [Mycolicibacterium rhodesiae NBB3]|uniref:Uncharacterized protein n=1 Tax=Mycolicibacterium rhodesiae (strain NBB3) TaxID=710685 RepID=G8RJS6_MYCRN|nr:hypothetical protein MycrhN_5548 [Mycolicibacterium rhodesiae NBB3]